MMFNPQPTPYDVSFRFLGFPVRVHPLFWVIVALIGSRGEIGNMKLWLIDLAIWIAAVFVAILVHELGHGLVFRHVFRVPSMLVLHGAGGLAIPFARHQRKLGILGFFSEVFLSAAGVLAGLLLVLLIYVFFRLIGADVHVVKMGLGAFGAVDGPWLPVVVPMLKNHYLTLFFYNLSFVCVFWGVLNLLPIYPLDGGHISREVFCLMNPRTGIANSLALSIITAGLIAVLWIRMGIFINAALFGYLAFMSWQALSRR
jgi:hypothetical protein